MRLAFVTVYDALLLSTTVDMPVQVLEYQPDPSNAGTGGDGSRLDGLISLLNSTDTASDSPGGIVITSHHCSRQSSDTYHSSILRRNLYFPLFFDPHHHQSMRTRVCS